MKHIIIFRTINNLPLYSIKFLMVLLGILSMGAFSQNVKISGHLYDEKGKFPLAEADILLRNPKDSAFVGSSSTNEEGYFLLKVDNGIYLLSIDYGGYDSYVKLVAAYGDSLDLGNIYIKENLFELDSVVMTGKIPPVLQKGDTTQYNASSYKTNPDATAENLLEKMPGMQIQNGKMQAQGEDVKQVMIDGQIFMGEDANAALKNIPAEMIDKIQMFDQLSDQAQATGLDDGNSQKTLNIVTKAEFKNGTFGKVNAGYGYDDKYSTGGVLNVFNNQRRFTLLGQANNINQQNFSTEDLAGVMSSSGGSGGRGGGGGGNRPGGGGQGNGTSDFLVGAQNGITSTKAFGVNYIDKWGKKIELTGSYFFNQGNNVANLSTYQDYFSSSNAGQKYSQISISESKNVNHRVNFRLTYKINKNNEIIYRPKLTVQTNKGLSNSLGQTMLSDSLINGTSNDFRSNLTALSYSNSLIWRHRFTKKGRSFSINLSQDAKPTNAERFLNAENDYYTVSRFDTLDQTSTLKQHENNYSANLNYSEPLNEKTVLELAYKPTYGFNNADKRTFNYEAQNEGYTGFDTSLSNVSKSTSWYHEASTGLRINRGKNIWTLRGALQFVELNTDQTYPYPIVKNRPYTNFLPSLMWRKQISLTRNIRLFYRTNTSLPSISQLQQVVDNTDPLHLKTGNTLLNQQYQHNLFIRYTSTNLNKNTMFFAMFGGSYIDNYISSNTTIAASAMTTEEGVSLSKGSQLTRPVNLNGYYNLRALSTYSFPIEKIKSKLNLSVSANYTHTPGMINSVQNFVNAPSTVLGLVLSSNVSSKLDFTLSSNSSYNQTLNSLNAALDRKYFNQTSKIRLYWNFWKTLIYRTELQNQYYNGLSAGLNTNYTLLGMSLGTKMFKNKQGELTLSVYDLLKQNNSVARVSTETYVQDTQTQVLQRYFMLSFKYDIKAFKKPVKEEKEK